MSHDHNPQFAWIPFDTNVTMPCVLCTHHSDQRDTVKRLIQMIQTYYQNVKGL